MSALFAGLASALSTASSGLELQHRQQMLEEAERRRLAHAERAAVRKEERARARQMEDRATGHDNTEEQSLALRRQAGIAEKRELNKEGFLMKPQEEIDAQVAGRMRVARTTSALAEGRAESESARRNSPEAHKAAAARTTLIQDAVRQGKLDDVAAGLDEFPADKRRLDAETAFEKAIVESVPSENRGEIDGVKLSSAATASRLFRAGLRNEGGFGGVVTKFPAWNGEEADQEADPLRYFELLNETAHWLNMESYPEATRAKMIANKWPGHELYAPGAAKRSRVESKLEPENRRLTRLLGSVLTQQELAQLKSEATLKDQAAALIEKLGEEAGIMKIKELLAFDAVNSN